MPANQPALVQYTRVVVRPKDRDILPKNVLPFFVLVLDTKTYIIIMPEGIERLSFHLSPWGNLKIVEALAVLEGEIKEMQVYCPRFL